MKPTSNSNSNNENIPSFFCQLEEDNITEEDMKCKLYDFLSRIVSLKEEDDDFTVLLLPPDYTRVHSQAGIITQIIQEYFSSRIKASSITILPALGTHAPMTQTQKEKMFGQVASLATFVDHDWRKDVVTVGHVPAQFVTEATDGLVTDTTWPAQLNRLVWEGNHSLILSIGQVVPHEVMGMANFNKNLFVGVGGVEAINLSHFIGAIHGMERMMGKANNPLRDILNYASEKYLQNRLPLWYVLTVMGTNPISGSLEMKGFYIGNDIQCYLAACELSIKTNISLLDEPLQRVVVYLDPDEYHSTWLGNKAIYRTRMAIADGGHLIILAPGVSRFGEDDQVDRLLRKYGYRGTSTTLQSMKENEELQQNLSAVSHLIHGSTEERFTVTYCPGKGLSREEIENVGYRYGSLAEMKLLYPPEKMTIGWNNNIEGGSVYYIPNPALGLWAVRSKFEGEGEDKGRQHPKQTNAYLEEAAQTQQLMKEQCASEGSGGVGGWMKPPS